MISTTLAKLELLAIMLLGLTLGNASAQAKSPTAANESLETILATIRSRTNDDHPFFGDAAARKLRRELKGLVPRNDPGTYLKTLMVLGNQEIDLGNLDEGIARLTEAYDFLNQLKVPNSIRAEICASLGNAYLRLAESENCCASYSPESCIVPLKGNAIHQKRRGSEQAINYFAEVFPLQKVDQSLKLKCAWLTNVAYMTLGEYPDKVPSGIRIPPATFRSKLPFPQFANISHTLGLDQFNLGGGAIMDDFDGDHDLDLITSSWDTAVSMQFHQNQGNGTFTNRSVTAGLANQLGGLNLVQADYDNDGDLDVYVLRGAWLGALGKHPNSLLQNQGDGTFIDRTLESGLGKYHYPSQTAAWADYDNDGDLDLYVGNETIPNEITSPCQLFRNQGNGTFIECAKAAGVTNERLAKGVAWGDIDGDRWPDLIVSNLGEKNRLYHNQGDGTFVDRAAELGVDRPIFSFPLWTWDYNNDGLLDLFISSYDRNVGNVVIHSMGLPTKTEPPGHYQGTSKGQFTNRAKAQGLTQPMMPMGSNIGDLNNDGYLDFYLGTGEPQISVILPNMMYLNLRGARFADITMAGGFGHLQKGHAVVFADYDEDGDQDVFEQMGGAKPVDKYRDALYANPGFKNNWLKVKLIGTKSNRSAIGAQIRADLVDAGKKRSVYRHIGSGGSFGANPLREHIGLGAATQVTKLDIYWPTSNQRQTFDNVSSNQFIEITEGSNELRVIR